MRLAVINRTIARPAVVDLVVGVEVCAVCASADAISECDNVGVWCPLGGMHGTWVSGSDVNSFCCYGFAHSLMPCSV
jgi:hypothetical protein